MEHEDLERLLAGDQTKGMPSFAEFLKDMAGDKPEIMRIARKLGFIKADREHVDFMTKEETDQYNELRRISKEMANMHHKMNTLRDKMWADISIRLNSFNESLHIDEKTSSIQREVE